MCTLAILDNILMYDKNIELSKKLDSDRFNIVYNGSELNDILVLDKPIDILLLGNLGSKDYMDTVYHNILSHNLASKIIYLLPDHDFKWISSHMNASVFAIISYKDYDEMTQIIDKVCQGTKFISLNMHGPIMKSFSKETIVGKEVILSEIARDVLLHLSEGLHYVDIANKIGLSLDSVRYYVKELYGALGVNNKGAAVGMFLRKEIEINTASRVRKKNNRFNAKKRYVANC
jgi:DNA-binding NarL/FixJ family response regulator